MAAVYLEHDAAMSTVEEMEAAAPGASEDMVAAGAEMAATDGGSGRCIVCAGGNVLETKLC